MYNFRIMNTCNFISLHSNYPENSAERFEDLAFILKDMRENDCYDISQKSISAIRENLLWLERYLDDNYSEHPSYKYNRLMEAYKDCCAYFSEVLICQAIEEADII